MKALLTALEEIFGLFVEDGSLAIGILIWVGLAAFTFSALPEDLRAPILFAGLVALLVENTWRSARKHFKKR